MKNSIKNAVTACGASFSIDREVTNLNGDFVRYEGTVQDGSRKVSVHWGADGRTINVRSFPGTRRNDEFDLVCVRDFNCVTE